MLNLSYGNVISTIILLVALGMWAGGVEVKTNLGSKLDALTVKQVALDQKIDKLITKQNSIISKQTEWEKQLLVWMDDAENQRKFNHRESMDNIKFLHDYNKSQNSQYVIPEKSTTRLIFR